MKQTPAKHLQPVQNISSNATWI